jgi:hypothetical protein
MDDANLVEKLDLKHSCFGEALLLEWRNGKTCCHACFTEYGKIEIFLQNGLYRPHSKSSLTLTLNREF